MQRLGPVPLPSVVRRSLFEIGDQRWFEAVKPRKLQRRPSWLRSARESGGTSMCQKAAGTGRNGVNDRGPNDGRVCHGRHATAPRGCFGHPSRDPRQ